MVDDSSEAKPNSPRKGRRMASNLSEYKQTTIKRKCYLLNEMSLRIEMKQITDERKLILETHNKLDLPLGFIAE
jgi:hypothetical protein